MIALLQIEWNSGAVRLLELTEARHHWFIRSVAGDARPAGVGEFVTLGYKPVDASAVPAMELAVFGSAFWRRQLEATLDAVSHWSARRCPKPLSI